MISESEGVITLMTFDTTISKTNLDINGVMLVFNYNFKSYSSSTSHVAFTPG
jgi:hypothetical protein